jgi:hypothetical protein
VRGVQTHQGTHEHGRRHGWRNALAARAQRYERRGQVDAVHVLHHDADVLPVLHHVERLHHIGVPHARRQLRLFEEQLVVFAVRELGLKQFQRDDAREAGRPDELSQVEACRAPGREGAAEPVAPDALRPRAGTGLHRGS